MSFTMQNLLLTPYMYSNLECPPEVLLLVMNASISIQSVGYPGNYVNNLRCTWTVTPVIMKRVLVQFLDLDLERCCDHLFIGNSTVRKALTYTGASVLATHVLSAVNDSLEFEFRTDGSVTRKGFSLLLSSRDIEGNNDAQTVSFLYLQILTNR